MDSSYVRSRSRTRRSSNGSSGSAVISHTSCADDADTRPAPWMCEIDRCRDRCAAACDVVLLEDNQLRFARLCADHYNTLHMYFGRGRCGPGVLRYHTLAQINEFVYAYCTHDHTRMRFLKRDGADHFFGEKKK